VRFPVGDLTKAEVRAIAAERGLRTAAKPDSQDVCFISATGGRRTFLEPRIELHPGRVVDASGATIGAVDALELVTVGQRRGLSTGGGPTRYAIAVDTASATVTVGSRDDLLTDSVALTGMTWVDVAVTGAVLAQTSAHGRPVAASVDRDLVVTFAERERRVASGQAVVLYDGDAVLGGGTAR
jgi:tRNA-specific 2-thiouridylase